MHPSQQQSTQPAEHLWGFLNPLRSDGARVEFGRSKTRYTIGRHGRVGVNDIVLSDTKISNVHCIIEWDGGMSSESVVKVTDLSSNGTFINGEKIGRGNSKTLHDKDMIAFGTAFAQLTSDSQVASDSRFIFGRVPASLVRGLLGTYDIRSELGKGGFGTVKKALHRAERKWYAVKMIPANNLWRKWGSVGCKDGPQLEPLYEFTREIHILETLCHRNICQLKEVFVEDYGMNLVLEWVQGGDLADYIFKKQGLSEPEARYFTTQICDALAYVHRQGIVHRDIKPENILLTADDPPIVKVADFGLAKVFNRGSKLRTRCGTPIFTAPEVTKPHPRGAGYDFLVDSWSVGVMVFCMLTVILPFPEDENEEPVSQQHIAWSILRERNVSNSAENFIGRLLEYDPQRRMAILDARHHHWLRQDGTQTQPEGLGRQTGPTGIHAA